MQLALIVAQARNRVIGRNNKLPWHLPEDLQYFRAVTMGKVIVMGRKTFESIGRPLPGRTNLVLTRDHGYRREGIEVAHSLDEALAKAEAISLINGSDEVMVIGGDELFAEALPRAERLYLTQVHQDVCGDAYFPELDWSQWHEVAREDHSAQEPNPYDYSFIVLDRRD